MFMGLGMPIPDLSNKPGPGRPGWPGDAGSYDFQFRVEGQDAVVIKANAAGGGSFTIKWPNGNIDTYSGNNASITAPDATDGIVSINNENDTDYCDEFAVIGGKGVVREVISWGQNPWGFMSQAFNGCTSLSDISTTKFIASSGANIVKMFNGCTSLLEADIRNWDLTAGVNWQSGSPFGGLVNLEKLDMTGMNIKLTVRSDNAFSNIGTAVTNGCEFLMSGINWSTSTSDYTVYWFQDAKLNPNSNLSNWIFPTSGWQGLGMFNRADITGTNSTLNLSGWSTYSGTQLPQFGSFNAPAGDTGLKVDMTNMGMSNVNKIESMFNASHVSGIIGLSTWGATAGNVNMGFMFQNSRYMKFSDSDNFSSTFINSLTPSSVRQCFLNCGSYLTSNYGAAPNITNIDLSNCTTFHQFFSGLRCTNVPAINTATFPSTAVPFSSFFLGMRVISNNETHVDFSNTTIKISNATAMFNGAWVDKVTFGNNVDFSALTTVNNMHYYMNNGNPDGTTTVLTYPTNADFSSLASTGNWFAGVQGPTTGPLTTCQIDNLIRSFHNTALNSGLTVNFYQSQITEAPSVVSTLVTELENTGGWNITSNTLDGTIPFEYTGSLAPNTPITPTNNTGSAFTGTFTSNNSNIAVNSTTGVINSPNGGSTTIRYTLADGCYTEQAIELVSAEFSYSASAYCQDASDPTPTITGTSGGAFSAVLKVIPFQMEFEVSPGASKTISIPGVYGSSFTIDWGDGFTETSTGGGNRTISHTYNDGNNNNVENPTVSIGATGDTGPFTKFAFNNTGSKSDLLDVPQWGNIAWSGGQYMFKGCNNVNFQISATDYPDFTNATNINLMFNDCTHFNSSIDHWDVSTITNLYGFFRGCNNYNQSLNSWDVSNVTNFTNMFLGASSFNSDISSWDMSSCQNTANMFYTASSFNQDISGWNFSNAWTNANQMFFIASSFNQNLGSWNVSGVTNMSGMFRGCTNFNNNGGTLSGWNVGSVTNMSRMFQSATSFVGTGLDSWNPSSCTNFSVMLYGASSFNQNLGSWSLNSSLTTAASMLTSNTSLTQANYTDTLVGWANTVYTNSGPYNVPFTGNSFSTKFDATRSGGANFTTAQDAYNYLVGATASWSIS